MQLIKNRCEEGFYTLEFKKSLSDKTIDILLEFKSDWQFGIQQDDEYSLNKAAGVFIKEGSTAFPIDIKTNLLSIPLHIPSLDGRTMFKACMDFFVKRTSAPVHVGFTEHPGYPLTVVNFDFFVIKEEVVNDLIDKIMKGISEASTYVHYKEVEKSEPDEEVDELDENHIVEYEEDEELKSIMKQPIDRTIKSIDGGDYYD